MIALELFRLLILNKRKAIHMKYNCEIINIVEDEVTGILDIARGILNN